MTSDQKDCLQMLGTVIAIIAGLCVALSLCGCVYKGAKVTEGTDLAIGLNVPLSEGTLQFQALNYLSGFRLGVDRNAVLECTYSVCESNSYLGVVQTRVAKEMTARIVPVSTNAVHVAPSPVGDGSASSTPVAASE